MMDSRDSDGKLFLYKLKITHYSCLTNDIMHIKVTNIILELILTLYTYYKLYNEYTSNIYILLIYI